MKPPDDAASLDFMLRKRTPENDSLTKPAYKDIPFLYLNENDMRDVLDRARAMSNYVPLTAKDRKRLGRLVRECSSAALRELYKGVSQDPELVAKISAPLDSIERRQAAHLSKLIEDPDEDDYLDRVDRVGKIHVRIGLTPESYVVGYASNSWHPDRKCGSALSLVRPTHRQDVLGPAPALHDRYGSRAIGL